MFRMFEPRSDICYDNESKEETTQTPLQWSDVLSFPFSAILTMIVIGILPFAPVLIAAYYFFGENYPNAIRSSIKSGKLSYPLLAFPGAIVCAILVYLSINRPPAVQEVFSAAMLLPACFIVLFTIIPFFAYSLHWITQACSAIKRKACLFKSGSLFGILLVMVTAAVLIFQVGNRGSILPISHSLPGKINIVVDDFAPQPYQGQSTYFFNRLEGDRGAINDSLLDWGNGQVTTTISRGNSWGGVWMSLNHPIREGLTVNFSAILPSPILPAYQSQITGITVQVVRGTPGRIFRLELKEGSELRWDEEVILKGGEQTLNYDLPPLEEISQLVWVLDRAHAGDFVTIDNISFSATNQIPDTATAAFVWSYGMLLNNWNPATGLVRDKAREASGEFEAVQAAGSLAAATAVAEQLGIVDHAEAVRIVNKISEALLLDLPRLHGLWPHWVEVSTAGEFVIVENTEWSSIDTVIAALGLLEAQSGLRVNTASTEQFIREIEWDVLVTDKGISHGYNYAGDLIPYTWDTFGGESWLVELAYAGAMNQSAPLAYPSPPTVNGSGFIDELAWLFVPPPTRPDAWGTDWTSYRRTAADRQMRYFASASPASCFIQFGLFGLSAGEVPAPATVPLDKIYQAYGIGGAFADPNDGMSQGMPVITPHYSAMIASLYPEEAIEMWDWLIASGNFSPLTNVESLAFPANSNCDSTTILWNPLKGSWNLSLQTLGWGRYLAERYGKTPILWQAVEKNPLLLQGHSLLAPDKPKSIAVYVAQGSEVPTTRLWDHTQVSCDGKPFDRWGAPGSYLYQTSGGSFLPVELELGETTPSLGVQVRDRLSLAGKETIETNLGILQATRLSANGTYGGMTGRLDYVQGSYQRSEWYVCGYGLVKVTSSDSGSKAPGNSSYSNSAQYVLVSFTPPMTNEAHVRYILADLQLGRNWRAYRAQIADEETAEALRLWQAGVRVDNLNRFERKKINEQWRIVYAGTDKQVNGLDIHLFSDRK